MKKIILLTALSIYGQCIFAQHYIPTGEGSVIKFSIKNFGLNVSGSFKGAKGKIYFNPANISLSFFNISVNAATINTSNSSRDGHLKKGEYFDVENFPDLDFLSAKISNSIKPGILFMEGTIKIKGVVKNISFPFTAKPVNDGYLFSAEFKLNRRDFKVGGSSFVLSDNLIVSLSVVAKNI